VLQESNLKIVFHIDNLNKVLGLLYMKVMKVTQNQESEAESSRQFGNMGSASLRSAAGVIAAVCRRGYRSGNADPVGFHVGDSSCQKFK